MKYASGIMPEKFGAHSYISPSPAEPAALPTPRFLLGIAAGPLIWLWLKARQSKCDDIAWANGSVWVADLFEAMGGRIIVAGLEHVAALQQPCVFIANHMSTLETFLLPGMIRPLRPVTFVVKKSLTTMPIFGPVMRSREPVVVERKNPRADLAAVMKEGVDKLTRGISVIVFPQHTRSLKFDAEGFNSIGVKLAARAEAPVIPLALKTDAWGQGKKIKELGKIRPDLPARFKFGPALRVSGNGKREHAVISQFICDTVANWQAQDGVNIQAGV